MKDLVMIICIKMQEETVSRVKNRPRKSMRVQKRIDVSLGRERNREGRERQTDKGVERRNES